jgi:Cu(I)/Ag(I) efflux system membrane protein CusA/SilA
MTVSTVIAGLLPIMWSTRAGSEVMKPLATPVLGGMASSLVHVLIVTPVIFFWLRERQLGLRTEAAAIESRAPSPHRRKAMAVIVVLIIAAAVFGSWWMNAAHSKADPTDSRMAIVHTKRTGDLEIVLRSSSGALHTGRNAFLIEFRDATTHELMNVGDVHASANMTMPGMVMPSGLEVSLSNTPGRYQATAEFGMAGAWQIAIEWSGAAGKGSANFQGMVQ